MPVTFEDMKACNCGVCGSPLTSPKHADELGPTQPPYPFVAGYRETVVGGYPHARPLCKKCVRAEAGVVTSRVVAAGAA